MADKKRIVNPRRSKLVKNLVAVGLIVALPLALILSTSNRLTVSKYTVTNKKIPASFDGYVIVQLSDLHNAYFGDEQEKIISEINDLDPDMILFTGDMVNRDHFDYDCLQQLIDGIASAAPIYAITGNHELDGGTEELAKLIEFYNDNDVIYIEGASMDIPSPDNNSSEKIVLTGQTMDSNDKGHFWIDTSATASDETQYNVLLNHYSNNFDAVSTMGYDLVFSGHTHGGIIRLPFVGGLFANNFTLFPKYDGGVFERNGSTLISSRGLSDSVAIPRIGNPPDLVAVTLKTF